MRPVGLFEAKQKLSELVDRASKGEQIGITRRGKLVAVIAPALLSMSVAQAFANIDEIRKRVKPLRGIAIKDLIEVGRR